MSLGTGFESLKTWDIPGSFFWLPVCGLRCELLVLAPATKPDCCFFLPTITDSSLSGTIILNQTFLL